MSSIFLLCASLLLKDSRDLVQSPAEFHTLDALYAQEDTPCTDFVVAPLLFAWFSSIPEQRATGRERWERERDGRDGRDRGGGTENEEGREEGQSRERSHLETCKVVGV